MKHGMPTRASIGKISSFLQGLKRKRTSHSPIRWAKRSFNNWPNSTKIGAGVVVTARRSLPVDTIHKRDHRSNIMIGVQFGSRLSVV